MLDGKELSSAIRRRKKNEGQANLRQDMDYAGQEAVDPNTAWDEKQNQEVSDAMDSSSGTSDNQDHAPATDAEMGENESSQDEAKRKKISARLAKYLASL